MKSIIIYYSYSGTTKSVAQALWEYLIKKGRVDTVELKGLDESRTFFGQAFRAFWRKRARIQPVNFDLAGYDLICLGTPVWAFGPAPAINAYLDKCFGLEKKGVLLFNTYGSGTGNKRCLDYMQRILEKKGAGSFNRFSIQRSSAKKTDLVLSRIKKALS